MLWRDAAHLPDKGVEQLSRLLKSLFAKKPTQITPADREAVVHQIAISPRKVVAYVGQPVSFSAEAFDFAGQVAQGVRISYSSSDASKLRVDNTGIATCLSPGLAWVTASVGTVSTRVPVLVRSGARHVQTDVEWKADQSQLNLDGSLRSSGEDRVAGLLPSLLEKLSPTVHAQTSGGDSGDDAFDDLWGLSTNLIGHPLNRISENTHIGTVLPESSNFNMAIPIINNLPGRGPALDLTVFCNSQLWSRTGSTVVFNAVNTWPAPGFSLSFGRIATYTSGANTAFLLADPDGTVHYLGAGAAGQTNTYESNDGSHIVYVGNATSGGTLHYMNGSYKTVTLVNNRLLVTRIGDTNGNYITISYMAPTQPNCNNVGFTWNTAISSVTDTLGRVIQFSYDNCNNLTSITGPGFGGTPQNPVTITLAQFDYSTQHVSTSFGGGLTVQNVPTWINVIHHIYFPTTQTGYLFPLYSSYGMACTVSKRVAMSVDGSGNISDGTEVAHATFNYPTTDSSLTDIPAFTQRTESPGSANPFVYAELPLNTMGPHTLTITVTPPDAASNPSYPVQFLTRQKGGTPTVSAGLLTQSEIRNYSGTSFRKTVTAYIADAMGAPLVQAVTTYDDTGTPIMTDYAYDSYGNVTQQQDYGFQIGGTWQVRRKTVNAYQTDASYANAYLRNLLTEKDVYDQLNGGTQMWKETRVYDNYAAMGNMENYGGNYGGGSAPPGYESTYNNQGLTLRGNLTGVSKYWDITNNLFETFNNKIDIFGNAVQQQASCCNIKSYTFGTDTDWSAPDQVSVGSTIQLTKLITTDFNTSLKTAEADPNSQTTSFGYDNSGRPTQETNPAGGSNQTSYNDAALTRTRTLNFSGFGVTSAQTSTFGQDGWGEVVRTQTSYGGQVNATYDPLGRKTSETNPFPINGSPGPLTTYQYDPVGRVTVTTTPDGNTTQNTYSGNTATVTNQVGQRKQFQYNGFHQLVQVLEPDASGALTQATTYSYDILGDLTQVSELGQIRKIKYDNLKRKIYELQPEQSATINDGTGTMWSAKYSYTSFNALATKTTANGAVVTYGYDSINRPSSVTYDLTNAPNVAPTNNVTFTYNTQGSSLGLFSSVTMTGPLASYTENFAYDPFERATSRTWSRDGLQFTIGYGYNTANNSIQLIYPDGRVVDSNINASGLFSSITEPAGPGTPGGTYLSNVAFSVAGQLTGDILGNGVNETYGRDSNRLQLISQTASLGTNTLLSLNYSYQAAAGQMGPGTYAGDANQLTAINNSSQILGSPESASYTYDPLGRLSTSSETTNASTSSRRFIDDAWGNRLSMYDATSGGNQIESITLAQSGGVPTNRIQSAVINGNNYNYTYDADGNVTSDGVNTYKYDAENRLQSVNNGAIIYAYDWQGHRIQKWSANLKTEYIWDGNHVIGEYDTGNHIVDYIYWGDKLIAEGSGSLLGGNGSCTFLLQDKQSIRVSMDRSGNVLGRQATLPYGEEAGESGTQEKHHLTAYEGDAETGLDFAFHRFYNQNVGRFMSVDPMTENQSPQDPQSWNRYAYVENKPKDATDPLGLCGCSEDELFAIDDFIGWGDPYGLGTLEELECEVGGGPAPGPPPNPVPHSCTITDAGGLISETYDVCEDKHVYSAKFKIQDDPPHTPPIATSLGEGKLTENKYLSYLGSQVTNSAQVGSVLQIDVNVEFALSADAVGKNVSLELLWGATCEDGSNPIAQHSATVRCNRTRSI